MSTTNQSKVASDLLVPEHVAPELKRLSAAYHNLAIAHNDLVRAQYAKADHVISSGNDFSTPHAVESGMLGTPRARRVFTEREKADARRWMIQLGWRCHCVFPKPIEQLEDMYLCGTCHKPFINEFEEN